MKEALHILGNTAHHLQRERGCAAIFLGSEGLLFRERMEAQFMETDRQVQALREAWGRWHKEATLKPAQERRIVQVLEQWAGLSEKREEIEACGVMPSHAIDYYSHQLIGPLVQTMVEIALYTEGNDPARVSAYNAFLQCKERVGLERAIGARGFIGYSFHNEEFRERLLFLLAEQENHRKMFLALADDAQKELLRTLLETPAIRKLDDIHEALRQSPESPLLHSLTPAAWFDLVTEKVDALHTLEQQLERTLGKPTVVPSPIPPESTALGNSLMQYQDLIHSLQLFSGIPAHDLDRLLQHGQVREFRKGKMLFLEGEQANRLYVILKGWVKLFKGTAAGEETILQMLSSGDSIMESAVFLNTTFPVSAQIVEDTILLSLPAPMIRERVRDNNELALNLLASMSYRSQSLIRQIENARLKSADERIGWFLLKLLLEQGHMSRCVELPYDKSLIASYLDMKRETFSRALKRLKEKGFRIENNTVVIPNLSSLCGYCDTETAAVCDRHGTPDCPNQNCTAHRHAEEHA
ncbi:MAG: nitrate- and nitrite sensing domain-containing protein [Alphaproteobacteria bacterium]|nr:nitrate- and nitrite sensing domain-containing protein [Alphaproteobacteria bacterium]